MVYTYNIYIEIYRVLSFQTPPVLFSASTCFGVATKANGKQLAEAMGETERAHGHWSLQQTPGVGSKIWFFKAPKNNFHPPFLPFLFLPFWPSETYDFIYNSDFDSHTPTHDGLKSSDRDRTSFELGSRDRTRNPESPPWKLPHPLKMDGW